MTQGFPPHASPTARPGWTDSAATREREVSDTVHRIIGDGSDSPGGPIQPRSDQIGDSTTTQVAREQTAEVAGTTKQAAAQVVDTVTEQAGQVSHEAAQQAKQLLHQVQSELSEQAASTQTRVAGGLQALADELSGMARNSEQDGVATDLARQAADRARSAAEWLGDRDPGSLLADVRAFARKKPGTYLTLALGAGVVAGRLTRGLTAPGQDGATRDPRPAVNSTPPQDPFADGRSSGLGGDVTAAAAVYDQLPPTGLGTTGALDGRSDGAP